MKLRPADTSSRELGWALLGVGIVSAAFAIYRITVVHAVPLAAACICALSLAAAMHYLRSTRR